jgi:hypothetical protein
MNHIDLKGKVTCLDGKTGKSTKKKKKKNQRNKDLQKWTQMLSSPPTPFSRSIETLRYVYLENRKVKEINK